MIPHFQCWGHMYSRPHEPLKCERPQSSIRGKKELSDKVQLKHQAERSLGSDIGCVKSECLLAAADLRFR